VRLLVGVLPPDQLGRRSQAIYFKVPDIHATAAALESEKVRFRNKPHVVHRTPTAELWLAEFADPYGNPLALMSETKPAEAP